MPWWRQFEVEMPFHFREACQGGENKKKLVCHLWSVDISWCNEQKEWKKWEILFYRILSCQCQVLLLRNMSMGAALIEFWKLAFYSAQNVYKRTMIHAISFVSYMNVVCERVFNVSDMQFPSLNVLSDLIITS